MGIQNQTEPVVIKGTKEGLIFYFNIDQINLEDLLAKLEKKLAQGVALIGNSQYAIANEDALPTETKEAILNVFAKYNMFMADIQPVKEMPKSKETVMADAESYLQAVLAKEAAQIQPVVEPMQPLRYMAQAGGSVLIYKTIRSGQTLHIVGNCIIMGDVNAGSHIMATGNIIVMGKLKGLAHAGTQGNRNAFIVAWQMVPVQIRIADMVSRSENHNGDSDVDYPEIAKIEDGGICIEPYNFSKTIYQKKIVIA